MILYIYTMMMVMLNGLIVLLLIDTIYKGKVNRNNLILYTLITTLVTGNIAYFFMEVATVKIIGNLLNYFLLNLLLIKLTIFQAIIVLSIQYATIIIGELFAFLVFFKTLNYTLPDILTKITISLTIHIFIYLCAFLFVLIYNHTKKDFFHENYYSYTNKLLMGFLFLSTITVVGLSLGYLSHKIEREEVFVAVVMLFLVSNFTVFLINNKYVMKRHENQEIKKMKEQLEQIAAMDIMTNTYNRTVGFQNLDKLYNEAKALNISFTICFVDVDNLKYVNDKYGHKEGDQLIVKVADILKLGLRERDLIIRIGGDEFLIVLYDCTIERAKPIWNRIQSKFDQLNIEGSLSYDISISCGFSEFHKSKELSVEKLIEKADFNMYENKKKMKEVIDSFYTI